MPATDAELEFVARLVDDATRAARHAREAIEDLTRPVDPLDVPVRVPGAKQADNDLSGLGRRLGQLRDMAHGVGRTAVQAGKMVGTGAAAMVTAGAIASAALFQTGVQADALDSKVETVFGRKATGQVITWAHENAASMGLAESEARGLAAGLGDLLVPMGFTRERAAELSTTTIGLAGALSEWSGGQRTSAEVAEILQSAVLGEYDALKSLGIGLSAAEVSAELARRKQDKLTGAALAQAEAVATLDLVMAKSVDAQNAFANGADNPIRKQAEFRAAIAQTKVSISRELLPVSAEAIGVATQVAKHVGPYLAEAAGIGARALSNLAHEVPGLVAAFRSGDLGAAAAVLDDMAGGAGRFAPILERAMTETAEVVGEVATVFREALWPAIQQASEIMPAFLTPLGIARATLGFLAEHTELAKVAFTALAIVLTTIVPAMKLWAVVTRSATAAQFALTLVTGKGRNEEALANRERVKTIALRVRDTALTALQAVKTAGLFVIQRTVAVATRAWAAAQWLLNAAMTANPLTLVIAAIVALVAAVALAWRESETFRRVVTGAWEAIKAAVLAAFEFIKPVLAAMVAAFKLYLAVVIALWVTAFQAARALVEPILRVIVAVVRVALGVIAGAFRIYIGVWQTVFRTGWAALRAIVEVGVAQVQKVIRAIAAIVGFFSDVFGKIKGAISKPIQAVVDFVGGIGGRLLSAVGDLGSLLVDAGKSVVTGLWDGIVSMGSWLVDKLKEWVKDKIPGPIRKALGIDSPSKVAAELGAYTVQGLALGMLDEARLAEQAAREVADRVAAASTLDPMELARVAQVQARAALSVPVVTASQGGQVLTLRHVVEFRGESPEGLTAADVADVIARDPRSAAKIESALRPARTRDDDRLLEASR